MPTIPVQNSGERNQRLEARITKKQKEILKWAADLEGRSLSDFVVQAASEAATRVIKDRQMIELSMEQQQKFVEAIINPPKPGKRLKAAADHYRKVMGK